MTNIDLDSLVGEHILDGVDMFIVNRKQYGDYEDCQMVRFRLNGTAYIACENPDDGYRSCLDVLLISKDPVTNVFPPVRVLGRKKENDIWSGVNDVLQLIDLVTGKTVLEVGTDNTDDYYPSFVGAFWPEHMATNQAISPAMSNPAEKTSENQS